MSFIEPATLAYSKDQIQQQVKRICTDPIFAVSDILRRFLIFIVAETLDDRSNQIKEYTIGLNVLHKPFGFNPKEDAIVRIHAGRLRRALKQYYKTSGCNDPIHVSMPTGSYVPVFADNATGFADRQEFMGDERMPLNMSQPDSVPGQFLVTGDMQYMDDRLQIRVQMTNRQTQEIVWNQVIEYKLSRLGVFDIQEDIAKKLAAAVGEFCRLIRQQVPAGKMAVA